MFLNNEHDSCLICLEKNGTIVLCSKCKYKYCYDCANKVNNSCIVCNRISNISRQNYSYINYLDLSEQDHSNINYSNIYFYFPTIPYFFIIWISIIVNVFIGLGFIILILFIIF